MTRVCPMLAEGTGRADAYGRLPVARIMPYYALLKQSGRQ